MQQEKQNEHGWDIDARLLMYADALRRGAALCASPNPNPSRPSGAPAARDPGSGLSDGSGAPQREHDRGPSRSTAASNPGSRGAPAADSGGSGAACEAAPAEAEPACAASSGVAAAQAAGLSGEGSAAEQPGISKPPPGGSAPPAHACRPAGSSAHAAAGQAATAPHSAPAHPATVAGPGVPWGHSSERSDAAPSAPACHGGSLQGGAAAPVGEHASSKSHMAAATGAVGRKESARGSADSLTADGRALVEAAACVAESAGPPTAPVPPTGKAALLPAAVAAISASASLAGDQAVIDKVLGRGAKAAAASLHAGAAAPVRPGALPKDACFAEVRAHAPLAQRAACARPPPIKGSAWGMHGIEWCMLRQL